MYKYMNSVIEQAAYDFAVLDKSHQEKLKKIILTYDNHSERWRALREYCNCNLFEKRINTYTLTSYLERLYL